MDNTSASQADDSGSIPGTDSAGYVGKVSRWPHTPCIRVRVPYPLFKVCALPGHPGRPYLKLYGVVAQPGEQLLCKQKVAGSIPVSSIPENNSYTGFYLSTASMSKGER